MIQDKICVAPHQIFDYDLDIQEVGHNGAEEYIRKDALLEWAKEHYTGLDITKRDMWDGGYNCAIKELIDKLNEM